MRTLVTTKLDSSLKVRGHVVVGAKEEIPPAELGSDSQLSGRGSEDVRCWQVEKKKEI